MTGNGGRQQGQRGDGLDEVGVAVAVEVGGRDRNGGGADGKGLGRVEAENGTIFQGIKTGR